jgi:UDP-N-acetylmuramoyl-L-alanyl-D-glutamate--2,6-diaminopimelate ligase
MDLKSLLAPLEQYKAYGSLDIPISGIAYDSRKMDAGYLFAALPGQHFHGLEFLPNALKAGAAAVLSDRTPQITLSIPSIVVSHPRMALAKVSNQFYGHPSYKLKLFGVTGTNGKTTTTFLLRSVLEKAGIRTGLLGTVQYSLKEFTAPSKLTTPESLDLQRMLRQMVIDSCGACVMEVSSHSLVQHRVTGCLFRASIFTNLTQDHLDYHQTMEEYFQAKKMLFDDRDCRTQIGVINNDDSFGLRLLQIRRSLHLPAVSYGFRSGSDFLIENWSSSGDGSEIAILYQGQRTTLQTPLIGRYNASNIAGVFACMAVSNIPVESIQSGVAEMEQVPGRLERIDRGQPFLIIIDYAHTEDALRQLLKTVRPYTKNKLIVLFGCGGERDRGKRPLMGKAAGELADSIILTSDNPRNEDPAIILQDIQSGVEKSGNSQLTILMDRRDAIAEAVRIAQPGDTLVLAGKGHEDYQIIGNDKIHFDEREVLAELIPK